MEDGENVDGSVVVDTEGDLLGGCVECAVGPTDGVLDGGAIVHTMSLSVLVLSRGSPDMYRYFAVVFI